MKRNAALLTLILVGLSLLISISFISCGGGGGSSPSSSTTVTTTIPPSTPTTTTVPPTTTSSWTIPFTGDPQGLILNYQIQLDNAQSPLRITLTVENIKQNSITFFVTSLMDTNTPQYFKIIRNVSSSAESINRDGEAAPLSPLDAKYPQSQLDQYTINTSGKSKVIITYEILPLSEIYPHLDGGNSPMAFVPLDIYYGCYEYILLRPSRSSVGIQSAKINHQLPAGWVIATTYSESNGVFDAMGLRSMYGDAGHRSISFAETLFLWGGQNAVSIIRKQSDGLEIIFACLNRPAAMVPIAIQNVYDQIARYFKSVMGPLPFDRRIQMNLVLGREGGYSIWPGVWDGRNHPMFGEWYTMQEYGYNMPLVFQNWVWQGNGILLDPTDMAALHRFRVAWLGKVDGVCQSSSPPLSMGEMFIYMGVGTYFQEKAAYATGYFTESQYKRRFRSMFNYYLSNWYGTPADIPFIGQLPYNYHYFGEFKAVLISYLLNEKIKEQTNQMKSMDDVMRSFYVNTGQAGQPYSLELFISTVKDVTGKDFTDFFNRYVYGTERLPLDGYI